MKKILIGVAGFIIVVGAIFVISGSRNGEVSVESGGVLTQEGTLKDFMSGKLGDNIMCDFTHSIGEDNELKVKTYISGENVRIEYTMKNPVPGESGNTQKDLFIIANEEFGYIWGDSFLGRQFQGFKMKMEDMESPEEAEDGPVDMVDFEIPVVDCVKWDVDESKFEIPGDIEFIDPDNLEEIMMGDIMPQAGGGEDSCSICNSIPDQVARDSCLSSMGCN